MITINPQAADVITINISDADQIQLNTTAIVLVGGDAGAAWGDITGTLSNQTDLQDALDLKLDSADYNDRFLGLFASLSDAGAILPTDQVVIYRNGMPLRTTVAILTGTEVEPEPSGFLLVPTGATESADGVFQRFVPDATDPLGYPAYYAELDAAAWQESPISVQFKWPALTVVNDALVIFFSSGNYDSIENSVGDETDSIYAALQIARTSGGGQGDPYNIANFDFYKFGVEPPTSEPVTLTPSAGDIATLTFTRTQMTLTVGGMAQIYTIPESTFAPTSTVNVVAKVESAVLPLSIKVAEVQQQ